MDEIGTTGIGVLTLGVEGKPKPSEKETQIKYSNGLLTTSVSGFTKRTTAKCVVSPAVRLFVETWTGLRRHGVFVLGANVLLSAPLIRQDTGKQKNQHFDMVSMALQPCCEEHQTLRAAGDLCARLRGYWHRSHALTRLRLSYSRSAGNAGFEVL